ncbi:hypothetical protein OSB04_016660 [Centaurea solstitialis]|uniref:Uncharacterized protein n=1 Tax=Centaurea solstitialis TaxID=347529 RepID=A0AA38T1D8_9ASTR|nr:hypothetical protein OSB04_016660 [Centaurea solstitialis]
MSGEEIYEEGKSIENSWGKGIKDTKGEFLQVSTESGGTMKRMKTRLLQITNKAEVCIAEENVAKETIGIPLDRHDAFDSGDYANSVNEGKLLSAGNLIQVCLKELSKVHFYVM